MDIIVEPNSHVLTKTLVNNHSNYCYSPYSSLAVAVAIHLGLKGDMLVGRKLLGPPRKLSVDMLARSIVGATITLTI